MISIDRTRASAPQALVDDGAADLPNIKDLVDSNKLKSKDFKKSIYGSDEVRDVLWDMQFHKCCFCERDYEKKFSTIEHFRPKTSARNEAGGPEAGYWWLGYEFQNLYFCCQNCNNSKNNWFPLASGERYTPRQLPWNLNTEDNLVIDPGSLQDPESHLTFVKNPSNGKWRIAHLDDYGKWTIQVAKLDRDELDELRDDYFRDTLEPIVMAAGQHGDLARQIARHHCKPSARFSLLAKSVYRDAGLV